MGLDVVDDDLPVSVDVHGSQRLDVGSFGGAEVGLLDDLVQAVNAVVGVGQNVLVHLLHGVVVVFKGLLDLVGGVLLVLETPGSWVSGGTCWWAVGRRVTIGGLRVVRDWAIWSWNRGVWRRSRAIAVWWRGRSIRSRCIGSRCVRSRCIRSWGVGSRCVG